MCDRSAMPDRRQILVIEPAVRSPNLDCFNQLALLSPLPLGYHLPALYGLDSLAAVEVDRICGVIVLGSAASVNDSPPWQLSLTRWLRELWARDLPTLGICYGHQLIAQLFGGRVGLAFPGGEKRRGFRRIRTLDPPAWVGRPELEVALSHREAVLECPAALRVFASSDELAVEAIAHREKPIFGFQAHLEATVHWLARHDLPVEDADRRLTPGREMLARFFALVAVGVARPAPDGQVPAVAR